MSIDWENAFRVGFIHVLKRLKHERMLSLCCRLGVSLYELKNPFKDGTEDYETWNKEYNYGCIEGEMFCARYQNKFSSMCDPRFDGGI